MKLFDSHCHLNDRAYDKDIDAVIKRAHDAGVRFAHGVRSALISTVCIRQKMIRKNGL